MPLYQFECRTCGERFEELTRLSERDRGVRCRKCGEPATRVLAGFAVGRGGGSAQSGAATRSSTCGVGSV